MLLLGDEEVCKSLGTLNTQFIGRDKDRVKMKPIHGTLVKWQIYLVESKIVRDFLHTWVWNSNLFVKIRVCIGEKISFVIFAPYIAFAIATAQQQQQQQPCPKLG